MSLSAVWRLTGLASMALLCGCAHAPGRNPCVGAGTSPGCAEAVQDWVESRFGLPPAETVRVRGGRMRRMLYEDGYGNDIVALTFLLPGRAHPN